LTRSLFKLISYNDCTDFRALKQWILSSENFGSIILWPNSVRNTSVNHAWNGGSLKSANERQDFLVLIILPISMLILISLVYMTWQNCSGEAFKYPIYRPMHYSTVINIKKNLGIRIGSIFVDRDQLIAISWSLWDANCTKQIFLDSM
jgi:hypothetical protein